MNINLVCPRCWVIWSRILEYTVTIIRRFIFRPADQTIYKHTTNGNNRQPKSEHTYKDHKNNSPEWASNLRHTMQC